jgi:hypothetical protein
MGAARHFLSSSAQVENLKLDNFCDFSFLSRAAAAILKRPNLQQNPKAMEVDGTVNKFHVLAQIGVLSRYAQSHMQFDYYYYSYIYFKS